MPPTRLYSSDSDFDFKTGYTGGPIEFVNHVAEISDDDLEVLDEEGNVGGVVIRGPELATRLALEFPHLFSLTDSIIPPAPPVAPARSSSRRGADSEAAAASESTPAASTGDSSDASAQPEG